MTELEHVLENFDRQFSKFRGQKIALYGGGRYTAAIWERFFSTYHFTGAVVEEEYDRLEYCWNTKCLKKEAIKRNNTDLLILTEHKKTGEPDYEAIHSACEYEHIALYNMYGQDELALHQELGKCYYHPVALWRVRLKPYEVVSIAAMDTLFSVQQNDKGVKELFLRDEMNTLVESLRREKKTVLFMARHAVPEEQIRDAFLSSGLARSKKELDRVLYFRAGEDLGFRRMREDYPGKRMIHIGTSVGNDGIIPRAYGIDTYLYRWPPENLFHPGVVIPEGPSQTEEENLREWTIKAIQQAEIVSFDVFDTLLMRKVLHPEDVFRLTAESIWDDETDREKYFNTRIQIGINGGAAIRWEEIGRQLQQKLSISETETELLLQTEWEIEKKVLTRREPVISVFEEAKQLKKRIILTSDMYFSSKQLKELLSSNGITGYERILVSCEHGSGKQSGLLEILAGYTEKRSQIVHIGDNAVADLQAAKSAGMCAVLIPSALTMAERSGWNKAIQCANTVGEKAMLGLVISHVFSNPFEVLPAHLLPIEKCLSRYAYSAAGPMLIGYLFWMMSILRHENYDAILFSARDGFLAYHLYESILRSERPELTNGIYFYTSRKASALSMMDQEKVLGSILSHTALCEGRELLTVGFDLPEESVDDPIEEESKTEYIKRHMSAIHSRAEDARHELKAYCERVGIKQNGRYAFMDFVSEGTTQRQLEASLKCRLFGLSVAYPLYGKLDPGDNRYFAEAVDHAEAFLNNYYEMEKVMCSPDPTVDHYDFDGMPVFGKENRTPEEIHQMQQMQNAITDLLNDYVNLFGIRTDIGNAFCCELYAADIPHGIVHPRYDDWCRKEW